MLDKNANDSNYSCSASAVSDELAYILSVDPAKPGRNFNNDPACFARYCEMQANIFREWTSHSAAMRAHCSK